MLGVIFVVTLCVYVLLTVKYRGLMLCLKLANSSVILAVLVSDIGWGAKPPKCHLAPTVKHTGQESGGELCEIFKF